MSVGEFISHSKLQFAPLSAHLDGSEGDDSDRIVILSLRGVQYDFVDKFLILLKGSNELSIRAAWPLKYAASIITIKV